MTGVNGKKPELTSFRDAVLTDTARRAGVKVKDAKKLRAAAERATPTMPEDSGIKLVQASTMTPRKASWLWNPYLPLGAPSLIAGAPGLGKTQLQLHLAAEVTRGRLDGDLHGEPRDVVMATAEDALAETMVPRLMAAGADLDRIHFIQVAADELGFFDIGEDLDALEAVAKAIEPALIVVAHLADLLVGPSSAG